MSRRVLVIGLDCAPPSLVFDRFARAMPNVTALRRRGAWGALRSTMPPITIPAWTCMVSGRDPGELGVYGFRKRVADSYELTMSDARDIHVPRVWDVLGEAGKRVSVLYVPPTSPPPSVKGQLVSCFLTRSPSDPHTFPTSLASDLETRFGAHAPDVGEVKEHGKLFEELYETARQHFAVARALWIEEKPDFLMMVEMGTDRLHHAVWSQLEDPTDPIFREARDYYSFLDAEIGALLEHTDDETAVLIVSDHGARTMEGVVCINEWLMREGWLVLKETPTTAAPLRSNMVDWSRTKAWGEGGYYARIFFNVEGREPHGIVGAHTIGDEAKKLATMIHRDFPNTRAHRPEDLYREVRGQAPELLVVFDDLAKRAVSLVGTNEIHRDRDDTREGDGCNHDWNGIFVATGLPIRGELADLSIYDVGPTILGLFGITPPPDWLGRNLA